MRPYLYIVFTVLICLTGYFSSSAQVVYVKAHASDTSVVDTLRHAKKRHKKPRIVYDSSAVSNVPADTAAHIKTPPPASVVQIGKSTYSYGKPAGDSTQAVKRHKRKSADAADMYVVDGKSSFNYKKGVWDSTDLAHTLRKDEIPAKKNRKKTIDTTTVDTIAHVDNSAPITIIDTAQVYLDSARYFLRKGSYREVSTYTGVIIGKFRHATQYPEALFLNGQSALANNDDAAAIDNFSKAIDAGRDKPSLSAEAYLWRGLLYYKQSNNDQALDDFNMAIKSDSANPKVRMAYYYRANCYRDKEQTMASMMNYTLFINADNYTTIYSAEALFNRAFYKMKLGDDRGAIRDYDKSLEIYRAAYPAKSNSTSQKDYEDKVVQVLIQRALAKSNIQHYDEAIADYNDVVKMRPNYALAFRLRGLAKIKKGSKDDGCLDLSHAGELGNIEAYDDIKTNCK